MKNEIKILFILINVIDIIYAGEKNVIKGGDKSEGETEYETVIVEPASEAEKMIEEYKKNVERIKAGTRSKQLGLPLPYQDNEDFLIAPIGIGEPINFIPTQIDTTSYKTWVASTKFKRNPSLFKYNLADSKTAEDEEESDTVYDEEGTINGNVVTDTIYLDLFKIDDFKFIEATGYEDKFNDYQNGKLGLGFCEYADSDNKEYCFLDRLKDEGCVDKRIFSLREVSDTHGELIIGDIADDAKGNSFPLLNVAEKEVYENLEDDVFKMSWLTDLSNVAFRNKAEVEDDEVKKIFENSIITKGALASFDSSCHYIIAPYQYISTFQKKFFDVYLPNVCRKVNRDGSYMFYCNKNKFEEVSYIINDLSLVLVMSNYGFEVPMNFLFEQTTEDDYEFFVHFKYYEQDIWNIGHPFFHHYTISFDQDNKQIGVYSDDTTTYYSLKEEKIPVEEPSSFWGYFFFIIFVLLLLCALFFLGRKYGIKLRLNRGVDPNLVDGESADDLEFDPGNNVR